MTVEYRQWKAEASELRADGDGMTFMGLAIVYNSRSEPLPFREVILPGASERSLKSRNEIKAFINHDTNLVIGSTRSGTLRLSENERGVPAEIDLPDTTYGLDLSKSVKRGDTSGMSFGFSVVKDKWNDDYSERTISELRIHEVSVVTGFPAYTATTATVRALMRLAHRTHTTDIDALAEAYDALSAGEINNDQASLLVETVERLRPQVEEAAPVEPDLSGLLQMKSDLLKKLGES